VAGDDLSALRVDLVMSRLIPDDIWATLTLIGECEGESYLGQVCVGEVIRTRMRRRVLSDGTLAGTIFKPKQFSCWNEDAGSRRVRLALVDDTEAAWPSCLAAWLESKTSDYTRGATHYLAVDAVKRLRGGTLPSWAADARDPTKVSATLITRVEGAHTFLKL
jgi:hypothetical protein